MNFPLGTGRNIRVAKSVHEGGVFSICALKGGRIITGGGRDRRLVEWDIQLNRTGKIAEVLTLLLSNKNYSIYNGFLLFSYQKLPGQ